MATDNAAQTSSSTALPQFSTSLPMLLLRAREAVMARFRQMLRSNGLTEQQWRVLRTLRRDEAVEVSVLARATFLLGPSLSRILPDLTEQALIIVEQDGRDQRRKLVRLTADGADVIERIAPMSEAIYTDIAGQFGREPLAQLQDLLIRLEQNLSATASRRTGGGRKTSQPD